MISPMGPKKQDEKVTNQAEIAKPTWILWDQIPWEEVNEKISRKLVIRDRMMMVMYRFEPHTVWPEEKHEAEQGGHIIAGRVELTLPSEGKKVILGPGDGYSIGSNVPHAWKTLDEQFLFIDIFSPPREELLEKKFAPNAVEIGNSTTGHKDKTD